MNRLIADALQNSRSDSGRIDVDAAATAVFAQKGKKFAFLFNQNARRTNMQIAELLSLVRQHVYLADSGGRRSYNIDIEFSTFDKIKNFLEEISFAQEKRPTDEFQRFVEEMVGYLSNKVLIEALYGTAFVFLPPHLDIDVALICGESGYIHSCGDLLLLRNAEKVDEAIFRRSIHQCISDFYSQEDRFLLVPYCHEDFSHIDRDSTPFLQSGLDDVKIHMSKAYIGATRLYALLDAIGEEQDGHLVIAPAGDYKNSTKLFQSKFPNKIQKTIFLISDSDLNPGTRFPGSRKFYIIYLQNYKNNNVYHIYDENKPGWASHTTLPHSLAGAMVSLARPWIKNADNIRIADPFGGSGTVLLEAQKISGMQCKSSDKAPIFQHTIRDNARFFNLSVQELEKLKGDLAPFSNIEYEPQAASKKNKDTVAQRFSRIVELVVFNWREKCDDDFLELEEEILRLGFDTIGDSLADRILTYVALKASVRGLPEFSRGTSTWIKFFRRELKQLDRQIANELTWRQSSDQSHPRNEQMLTGRGSYSETLRPRAPKIQNDDLWSSSLFEKLDVRDLPKGIYDAVITDPPYGFNTDHNYWEMASFVQEMIRSMVLSLKADGGQLILAAPRVSFSGKNIMPFVRSDYLSRVILSTCSKLNRVCVRPAIALPPTLVSVQPPYYWMAEKTLERRILHFWIRERSGKGWI